MEYTNSSNYERSSSVKRWLCCGAVDDRNVVADVAALRAPVDDLSEDYIEYTHDPTQHHVSVRPPRVVIVDNGVPHVPNSTNDGGQPPDALNSPRASERDQVTTDYSDEECACEYRELCVDAFRLVKAGAALTRDVAVEGHAHNSLRGADHIFNQTLMGLVATMAVTLQRGEGHECQYRWRCDHAVSISESIGGAEDAAAELRCWAALYTKLGEGHSEECITFDAGTAGAMAPTEPSVNGSGAEGEPPTGGAPDAPGEPECGEGGGSPPAIPESGPSSVYRLAQDVVEVKRHRRVRKHNRYARAVAAEIKNRLGCPAPNAANLLAVRRMANNIMEKHGVRPSHIRQTIELVVAGVFVPDEEDLRGAKVLQSVSVAALREELADAGPRSAWYDLFHPFARRRVDRVRAA